MRVWVMEQGEYSDRSVIDVYSSVDAALRSLHTRYGNDAEYCDVTLNTSPSWGDVITVTVMFRYKNRPDRSRTEYDLTPYEVERCKQKCPR